MKTLLVILLTFALLTPVFADDGTQQCPRDDSACVCTWEPDCEHEPPKGKPPQHGHHDGGHSIQEYQFTPPVHWFEIFKTLFN